MYLFSLFSPSIAHAGLDDFLLDVNDQIVNPLISFLFALAIVYFLYGVFVFIANQSNDEKKTTGKSHMLWGIVGITIMLGVWTILGVIVNTLNIEDEINLQEGTVELNDYNP